MKSILVISQYFYPEQFRINDLCQEWIKKGYNVTVVTGIPNYPQGKFYKGYGWFKKRKENINGVKVIRIPIAPRGKSGVGMVFNYFSFVLCGFFWKLFTRIKADFVFTFEVSPMTQALVGIWYAKRRKIPHYIYVQDLWPDNLEIVAGIKNKFILGRIGKMTNKIYKNSNVIFATSPSFVKKIQERVFDDKNKVKYLPQYAEDFYQPICKQNLTKIKELNTSEFKIVFTGNVGKAQGLDILPKTASVLKKENVKVVFVIVGDGRYKTELMDVIAKLDVSDYFVMIGRKPAEEIPNILGSCDVAFVSFMNNDLFANTIPAKLQSYMACGMPILASAIGETERVIKEANCGLCSQIGDEIALKNSIVELLGKSKEELGGMSKMALSYSKENFDKQAILNILETTFNGEDNK